MVIAERSLLLVPDNLLRTNSLCEGRYGWLLLSVKQRWMKEAMKVRILLTQLLDHWSRG